MGFVPAGFFHGFLKLLLRGDDTNVDRVAGKAVGRNTVQRNMIGLVEQAEDAEGKRDEKISYKNVSGEQGDSKWHAVVEKRENMPDTQVDNASTKAKDNKTFKKTYKTNKHNSCLILYYATGVVGVFGILRGVIQ